MNVFKTYHPLVNFLYFGCVIVFSMFFMNPVCLGISIICAFTYSVVLNGMKAVKFNLIYMFPLMIMAALINPAFSHEGVTILAYLPSGNPLTMESIIYGIGAAVMLGSVICWFSCYNRVMTSDKFIYLFGRIIPSLSLILSMTLRFVPRFKEQLKVISSAQRAIGKDVSQGSIIQRAKNGLTILSVMTTWALENAVETSDSMKSRGYGLKGRTTFSIFTFTKRDMWALITIIIGTVYVIVGSATGATTFSYYPYIKGAPINIYSISVYAVYFALCMLPVFIEGKESYKWRSIKSKI